MAFGNGVGVAFNNENSLESYIVRDYGNIIIEVKSEKDFKYLLIIIVLLELLMIVNYYLMVVKQFH